MTQNAAVTSNAIDFPSSYFWIGITDAGIEGEWTYGDGSVINFENWGPGEPASQTSYPLGLRCISLVL